VLHAQAQAQDHFGLGKADKVNMATETVDMTTEALLAPTEKVASPKPATKKKQGGPTIVPVTSNEQLKNQNVLVFECSDREKFGNFVGRHQSVKAGGLEPNRMKMNFTQFVLLFCLAPAGAYIGSYLGSKPHYEIPMDQKDEFKEACNGYGVQAREIKRDENLLPKGDDDFILLNHGTEEFKKLNLEPLINKICDEESVLNLLKHKQVSVRGVFQENCGFLSNNSLKRDSETYIMKPTLNNNMTGDVREKMVLLSEVTRIISKAYGIQMPFNNDKRNKEFAFQIDSGNIFEHASFNLSTIILLLLSHLDLPNDDDPANGYYKVVVAWRYFMVNDVLSRMVMVGTSRSSVPAYIVRAPKQKNFFAMMEEWHKNIAPWRKCKLSDLFSCMDGMQKSKSTENPARIFPPHMDKSVLYNGYAEAFLRFVNTLIENGIEVTFDLAWETLAPLATVTSASLYRRMLLKVWECGKVMLKRLGNENIMIAFMSDALKKVTSLSAGAEDTARTQPTFNNDTDSHVIINILHVCKTMSEKHLKLNNKLPTDIESSRHVDWSTNTTLTRRVAETEFQEALVDVSKAPRLGKFLGQHIIQVAARVGLLPVEFTQYAAVTMETKTGDRLCKMGVENAESIIGVVATGFGCNKLMAENMICEFMREFWSKSGKHPYKDAIYDDQKFLLEAELQNGRWVLKAHYREEGKQSEVCKFIPVYSQNKTRHVPIEDPSKITEKNWSRISSMDQVKDLLSTQEHKAMPVNVVRPYVRKANREKKAAKESRSKANKDSSAAIGRTTFEPTKWSPRPNDPTKTLSVRKPKEPKYPRIASEEDYWYDNGMVDDNDDNNYLTCGTVADEDYQSNVESVGIGASQVHRALLRRKCKGNLRNISGVNLIYHGGPIWIRCEINLRKLLEAAYGLEPGEVYEAEDCHYQEPGKGGWMTKLTIHGECIQLTNSFTALPEGCKGFGQWDDGVWTAKYQSKVLSQKAIMFHAAVTKSRARHWINNLIKDDDGKRVCLLDGEYCVVYMFQPPTKSSWKRGYPVGVITRVDNQFFFGFYDENESHCVKLFTLCNVPDGYEEGARLLRDVCEEREKLVHQEEIRAATVDLVPSNTKEPVVFWQGAPPEEDWNRLKSDVKRVCAEWPDGWTKVITVRQKGSTAGGKDQYWYTPYTREKLRSMVEVNQFIAATRMVEADREIDREKQAKLDMEVEIEIEKAAMLLFPKMKKKRKRKKI